MDIRQYYEMAKTEIEAHIFGAQKSPDKGKPFHNDGKPFYLQESKMFQENEQIRVSIHHPMWVRDPLKQPHSHDFFELTFVCEGSFMQVIDGKNLEQTMDQIVILRPDAYHAVWIEHATDVVFNILLRQAVVKETLLKILSPESPLYSFFFHSSYDTKKKLNYLIFYHTSELTGILQQIIVEYFDKRKGYSQAILSLLLMLFTECARILELPGGAGGAGAGATAGKDILPEILNYIEKNCLSVTQQSVAEHFSYSPRQFLRILKTGVGKNFAELVNAYKVEQVCMGLQEHGLPLKDIVQKMGFSDVNYFYKVFRRVKGISFSEYKKNHSAILP